MQTPNPFRQVEVEYFKLKGRLAAGRITEQQFHDALQQLMIQDAQGRYWMLGKTSGKWNVYDGVNWQEADPYAQGVVANSPPVSPPTLPQEQFRAPVAPPPRVEPRVVATPPPQPAQAQKSGGCFTCRNLGCGCLALILLLVFAVGGIYLAYANGFITQQAALNFYLNVTGQGPAKIEVDNFRDDAITVNINQVDVAKDSSPLSGAIDLNAFDVKTWTASNPGKYRIDFGNVNQTANLGTCTLTVRGGDQYQFVTLPDKIVVNRVNNPASVGTDFVVATSSLCR